MGGYCLLFDLVTWLEMALLCERNFLVFVGCKTWEYSNRPKNFQPTYAGKVNGQWQADLLDIYSTARIVA